MARGKASKRAVRYGGVTVLLTVLVIAAAVVSNTILATLSLRYGWFASMRPTLTYPVTDAAYEYLDTYVMPDLRKSGETLEIIFCTERDEVTSSETLTFVYHTATELAEKYPDDIGISYLNIWERPSTARAYGVDADTSVVVKCGDDFRTCRIEDFFASDTAGKTVGYSGEKRFAVAMKAVVDGDAPMCYVTLNHGESFADYALLHAITDAGYTVSYLDAVQFDIPDDCELLVTHAPLQDLADAKDEASDVSELDKLDAYLARGGKHMVFVSADTFMNGELSTLEGYLAEWGVTFERKLGEGGVEKSYAVRDNAHALTADGYTFLGVLPESGSGKAATEGVGGTIRVGNATGMTVAKGYQKNGAGDFVSGDKTLVTLLSSYPNAEAWVDGRAVERATAGYGIVTVTKRADNGGCVMVCSSTEMGTEASMQAGAYDNAAFLQSTIRLMGKDDTPVRLTAQPFAESEIHSLTVTQARTITVLLVALPVVVVSVVGAVILIRRRLS